MKDKKKWSDKEIKILKEYYYSSSKNKLFKVLPGRSFESIVGKGSRLGLKRHTGNNGHLGQRRSTTCKKNISLSKIGKPGKPLSKDAQKRAIETRRKNYPNWWKNPEEAKKKMSEEGRGNIAWNKGLTKETDERVNRYAKGIKKNRRKLFSSGKLKVWNKGLTKETDERVNEGAKQLSKNLIGLRTKEKNPAWRGGLSFEPYGLEFNKELREKIRKRDNHTCQECGIIQEKLKRRLCSHHIDYNKKNNSPLNLISLCVKCHMKTNYNRKHWEKCLKERMALKQIVDPKNIKIFNENKQLIGIQRI